MFDTTGSFSILFWIIAATLIALVIFEPQCLALEDKFDKRRGSHEKKRNAQKNH